MSFGSLSKHARKFVIDNTPGILTALGVTGALTTAYLTGKASFKAAEIIANAQEKYDFDEKGRPLETQEKVELVWKEYIPAAGVAAATIACIIGANHIGTRRAAALASAYSLSEKAFTEYKDKVVEKVGEKKNQQIHDEIAQDRMSKDPASSSKVVVLTGEILCYDRWSGRYFTSDMETIRKAVNDINAQINNDYYASLTDLYDRIGLDATDESDEVGWNSDKLLDVTFSTMQSDTGKPCLTIAFDVRPIRGFHRVH